MRNSIIKILASVFFLGYIPVLSGTVSTIFGVILYLLVSNLKNFYFLATALLLILGFLICGQAEKIFNQKDSRYIVIDEVCGIMLTFFLIPPRLGYLVLGFLLFRLLDILKPPPIRNIGLLNGSLGIMSDDILAAVYANILLQAVVRFAS